MRNIIGQKVHEYLKWANKIGRSISEVTTYEQLGMFFVFLSIVIPAFILAGIISLIINLI